MIVLDTNVISALMAPVDNAQVVDWLDGQPETSIWTTSISIMEIRFGIERLAPGRRRDALSRAFEIVLRSEIDRRILGFAEAEAIEAAALMARRRAAGRPAGANDDMIAGIVRVNRATLATRNTRHFEDAGIAIVDPWAV
jgi:predicted nucleic acid-binding protein